MANDEKMVGYRKPPTHTKFRKGQSGNPKGRPKGARNLKTELEEEMREQIRVREGGVIRKVSKRRAVLKALAAKGAQGDVKASALLCNLMLRFDALDQGPDIDAFLAEEDLAILDRYKERLVQENKKPASRKARGTEPKKPKKEKVS